MSLRISGVTILVSGLNSPLNREGTVYASSVISLRSLLAVPCDALRRPGANVTSEVMLALTPTSSYTDCSGKKTARSESTSSTTYTVSTNFTCSLLAPFEADDGDDSFVPLAPRAEYKS